MSIQLIQQYHAQVEKIIRYGGTRKESNVRKPFQDLLEQYARQKNLKMIAELGNRTPKAHKARLKADKANGVIELDTYTTLSGIPPAAWNYKLGNRSAIEWVLDRY